MRHNSMFLAMLKKANVGLEKCHLILLLHEFNFVDLSLVMNFAK